MKVVISNVLPDNFTNFVLVSSFKRAAELTGVDTIIIHKYSESDFDVGVFITTFKKSGVERFVYISDSPSQTTKMAVTGVDGYCFEDEFYLEDEDELLALLEGLDGEETSLALAAPAIEVLTDFVGAFSAGEERIKAPIYLATVTDAVKELSVLTQQQSMQLTAMSSSAIEVFEKASQIIRNMSAQNKMIEEKLREIEAVGSSNTSAKTSFTNSVMFFAPYTYRSNAKLLLIREYAPCRYLTSFVLGYLHHLHYELNRRPKLIFVIQKGAGVAAKYADYPTITQENMGLATLYNGEVVVTNNPKKDVMKELLSKPNDVFVVVDRLYGSVDIVSGRTTKVCAVGSRSDVERYKVRPEDTIFSVTRQPKQLFELPVIKNFPVEMEARYAIYSQALGANYNILDMKIGLKAGE